MFDHGINMVTNLNSSLRGLKNNLGTIRDQIEAIHKLTKT